MSRGWRNQVNEAKQCHKNPVSCVRDIVHDVYEPSGRSLCYFASQQRHVVSPLLSLKHLVGRRLGAAQCGAVRRVQRVSGIHREEPEQGGVPGHGRPVRHSHQHRADVSVCDQCQDSIDPVVNLVLFSSLHSGWSWNVRKSLTSSGAGKSVSKLISSFCFSLKNKVEHDGAIGNQSMTTCWLLLIKCVPLISQVSGISF